MTNGWTAEIARLNSLLEQRTAERDEAREAIERMKNLQISELVYKNGKVDMIGSHPIFHILVDEASRMFSMQGATNFLSMTGTNRQGDTLDITIQKLGGKTPNMRLIELEAELADARRRLTAYEKLIDTVGPEDAKFLRDFVTQAIKSAGKEGV